MDLPADYSISAVELPFRFLAKLNSPVFRESFSKWPFLLEALEIGVPLVLDEAASSHIESGPGVDAWREADGFVLRAGSRGQMRKIEYIWLAIFFGCCWLWRLADVLNDPLSGETQLSYIRLCKRAIHRVGRRKFETGGPEGTFYTLDGFVCSSSVLEASSTGSKLGTHAIKFYGEPIIIAMHSDHTLGGYWWSAFVSSWATAYTDCPSYLDLGGITVVGTFQQEDEQQGILLSVNRKTLTKIMKISPRNSKAFRHPAIQRRKLARPRRLRSG